MNGFELMTEVKDEIAALHDEFRAWFRGESDDPSRMEASLAPDFTFITPQGAMIYRDELMQSLLGGRGAKKIHIRTDNVDVHWAEGNAILATYEEFHVHADYTTVRHSTVLLTRHAAAPGGFLWRHVHETWKIPPPPRQPNVV